MDRKLAIAAGAVAVAALALLTRRQDPRPPTRESGDWRPTTVTSATPR